MVRVSSPLKRQQRVSPSRKFKRRENDFQTDPRKNKRELSISNSIQEGDRTHPWRRSNKPLKLSSEIMAAKAGGQRNASSAPSKNAQEKIVAPKALLRGGGGGHQR